MTKCSRRGCDELATDRRQLLGYCHAHALEVDATRARIIEESKHAKDARRP